MPPKRQKDEPKAKLTEQQQEQLSKAREKANATRMANATIRKAEKKTETEEKKKDKEARLKKAREILGDGGGNDGHATEAQTESIATDEKQDPPVNGIKTHEEDEVNDVPEPKKTAPPKASKPQIVPRKPKDIYYEEKLKLLRQKQSKPSPDPIPEEKPNPQPEPKNDDLDTMTRNRLAYQMGQEQKKNFWRMHMGNEDYPETYF